MIAKATIRLPFKSGKLLKSLINALTPEVSSQTISRSKVTVAQEGLICVLTVEANDTVALRATLNAYMRWINSTINVLETLEK